MVAVAVAAVAVAARNSKVVRNGKQEGAPFAKPSSAKQGQTRARPRPGPRPIRRVLGSSRPRTVRDPKLDLASTHMQYGKMVTVMFKAMLVEDHRHLSRTSELKPT